jgi:hypothetical protein
MENIELIRLLNKELATDLADTLSYKEIHTRLAARVNELIKNDFERLVSLLYRIDVSEQKLKSLLRQSPDEDAGNIIAALVLERQQQKLKTRKQFGQRDKDVNEEEW